jgi:hypothetical protein
MRSILVFAACAGLVACGNPAHGGSPAAAPSRAPSVAPAAATRTPVPRFTSPTVDGYRVTVRPLVVIEPRANAQYLQYTVHFRLNKALRPLRDGGAGVNAGVKLSGLWAERVLPEGVRSRNCYYAGVSVRNGQLPHAKPNSLIRVRIRPRNVPGVLHVKGLIVSTKQAEQLVTRRVRCRGS